MHSKRIQIVFMLTSLWCAVTNASVTDLQLKLFTDMQNTSIPGGHPQMQISAQTPRPSHRFEMWTKVKNNSKPGQASTGRLVLGGVIGGAAGFAGGAFLAWRPWSHKERSDIDWGLEHGLTHAAGIVLIGVAGEMIGVPLGIHLANGRKGNLGLGLLSCIGATVLGSLASSADGALIISVPVLQFAGCIIAERKTMK